MYTLHNLFLGMVDLGEKVSATLKREFGEEALNMIQMNDKDRLKLEAGLEELFEGGEEIYKGYVDDPRNTDNAWIETFAVNFHDETGETLKNIKLEAGDDAGQVKWMNVDSSVNLYASHKSILEKVARSRIAYW
uniref:ADP-ribose pyrophosphatase n=1 Tax=Romanomermis culicivorax TaxID=13658 RepID=A0A915KLA4_ROMCU